jgi:hypothetical protein
MVEALIEAYDESGAWPADRNWERATAKHPARRTHVRVFGSWPTSGGGGGYGGGEAAWRGGTKRSGDTEYPASGPGSQGGARARRALPRLEREQYLVIAWSRESEKNPA